MKKIIVPLFSLLTLIQILSVQAGPRLAGPGPDGPRLDESSLASLLELNLDGFGLASFPELSLDGPGLDGPGLDGPRPAGARVPGPLDRTVPCVVLSGGAIVLADVEDGLVEKRKTIVKVFDVTAKDQLMIDNQFGQVKVNLWDKKDIRVDVVITANAPTDQRAQEYLSSVTIDEKRDGSQINLRTSINRDHFGGNNWNAWKNTSRENKNFIQIDYTINMPKNNSLVVKNKFGDTHIPVFHAPLTVDSKHGNFFATDLDNVQNVIQVAFGNAEIKTMKGGKLEMRFGDLRLDRASTLTLINKFGKLNIREVDRLHADIDYSGASIGTLTEYCKVRVSYSDNFRINQLPQSAENVDIQAAYSTVVLPAEQNNFDVTVTHGQFRYPTNVKVSLTNQPDPQEVRSSRTPTRSYEGRVGSGTGTRIKVISKFGDVSLRD
ncbi:hypothetical protein [Telluribacter sp. SYSU D00476]|uniref:hypothetical protein n=1 Tax=Telluribacter sp. SYSU D00476 TaxID=2811430 RepID=UPI001FF695BC|nr:hypothetical protein [Telluribacter sp. SYSU D00476]